MGLAADQQLKRPYCPERHQGNELLVFTDDPLARRMLEFDVLTEQASVFLTKVFIQPQLLFERLVRNRVIGPDLSMRMWIAGTHHLASILENLDVIEE